MKVLIALFGFYLIQLCSAEYPHCNSIYDPKIPCPEKYANGTWMDGNRPNPNELCSNLFFKCSNGVSYCYNCQIFQDGTMLYYDHSRLECEYRGEIAACSAPPPTPTPIPTTTSTSTTMTPSTTTTSTTTPITSTTTTTTQATPTTQTTRPPTTTGPIKFKCPEQNGFFPIEEGICSQDYYSCISGSPYVLTCPTGSLFDPALLICINATVASCNYQCTGKDGFYPVPGNDNNYCFSGFIHCIMQKAYPGRCPGTATFNPSLLYCVQREDFCDGGVSNAVTTPTPSTTPPATFVCPPGPGQYPVAGSCTLYYVCSNGVLQTTAQCPLGEIFNPAIQYCEAGAVVPGCPKVVSFLDYYRDSKFVALTDTSQ